MTGESVPILTAGCGPLHLESASEHVSAIRRSIELGVNYFDTSPFYAHGESQQVLAQALKEVNEPVFVATKVGHFNDRSQFRDASAILDQVHNNLRILGRTEVDLLQIHEADWRGWWVDTEPRGIPIALDETLDFADAPVMQALVAAREKGLCRFIGITGNTTEQLARVLHGVDVDSVLAAYNYNLLCRGAKKHVLPVARAKDAAFVIAGPLYNAKLADVHREWIKDPPSWMTPEIHGRYEPLCDLRDELGIPMFELAIRYVLGDPEVTTLLTASVTVDEVEKNVAAVHGGPLPPDIQNRLDRIGLEDTGIHPWLFKFWDSM